MADDLITKGIDRWQEIATILNNIIVQTQQPIDIDNSKIWAGFLHRIDNDDWEAMLTVFYMLNEQAPEMVSLPQYSKFLEVVETFKQYRYQHPRCMDLKTKKINTKHKAWGMIMVLREVWNKATDQWIPNK